MTAEKHEGNGVPSPDVPDLAETGTPGLDAVLGGGLPRRHAYLVQGQHGSGKTTLALQFCMAGARSGERVLYLSTSEPEWEIREIAHSHGWCLDGVTLHYHDPRALLTGETEQSVFRPSEVDLPQAMTALLEVVERAQPQRLVIDSLSEIRLLSLEGRWFRRQIMALKEDLARRQCTALLCDEGPAPDQAVQSIVHGVIELQQLSPDYGPDRRRLRVAKLRGRAYASGFHDFKIVTGSLVLFPRLAAAEHRGGGSPGRLLSGIPELDALLGGGADRGTAILLMGPSGTGKSTVATRFAVAAAERGEHVAMYLFDERIQTLMERAKGLDLGLDENVDGGRIEVRQVDPAELTPGEFGHAVREAFAEREANLVVIDSLAGYAHAMPNEKLLLLHLHELLGFLNQKGVTVLMVMTQHGLPGTAHHVPFDLSYISDSLLMFHAFEFGGELRRAISVYKRRSGAHESSLRELRLGPRGIHIGEPLRQFEGITSGLPRFGEERLVDVEDRLRE